MAGEKLTRAAELIPPYRGQLVNLLVDEESYSELINKAVTLPSIQISYRELYDLELLAVGAFSPLDRFMDKENYRRVLEEMRLTDGTLFPIPITLSTNDSKIPKLDKEILLRSPENEPLAIMTVEDIYPRDFKDEARLVYGTTDPSHPTVAEMNSWGKYCLSGPLKVLQLPKRYSFQELYRTPRETRAILQRMGYSDVVAFQTRNPMHRAHEFITKRAMEMINGALLIHPAVGLTKPGDVDTYVRIRCYKALVERYYDPSRTLLSLLPLAMRLAGPREALWHGIIRRNYGANYFIVGRDHAGVGNFYGPYEAWEIFKEFPDLGITPLFIRESFYCKKCGGMVNAKICPHGEDSRIRISGTKLRKLIRGGEKPPKEAMRPEVAEAILSFENPFVE